MRSNICFSFFFSSCNHNICILLVTRLLNPSRPDPGWSEKINLNFFSHFFVVTSLRFYTGLKTLHKNFWRTKKKYETKNQVKFYFNTTFLNARNGKGFKN